MLGAPRPGESLVSQLGRFYRRRGIAGKRPDAVVGRFQAEARHAARLHHPNVVQVFDVDRAGDVNFYSMELMEGGSVETRLRESGRLPVEQATALSKATAQNAQ